MSLINQREYNNKKRAVIKNLEKEIKKRHPRFNNTPNIVIRHKFSKLIKEIKKSPDVLIENITYYNLINVILGWENLVEQIPMLENIMQLIIQNIVKQYLILVMNLNGISDGTIIELIF